MILIGIAKIILIFETEFGTVSGVEAEVISGATKVTE
jgi:hypothetical protein